MKVAKRSLERNLVATGAMYLRDLYVVDEISNPHHAQYNQR
jgi:hypothetical protein